MAIGSASSFREVGVCAVEITLPIVRLAIAPIIAGAQSVTS